MLPPNKQTIVLHAAILVPSPNVFHRLLQEYKYAQR